MAVFKCKMCGGELNITEGESVCVCEYCGTRQTVPSLDNEKKISLFNRANRLRYACEFDKASGVYESIVSEFQEEPEAYWGLVLCKYGIEYVDDPQTGKKIPTCHRSSFDSVMDDPNFDMVMEYSDPISRAVYRSEAKEIERIRSNIIDVSLKEEPYDIFICYKEKDENGERTIDSVMAQDVYEALVKKGYRVFFSRISLEDKLGEDYEPYIFAALNSAKIMLAFGTDYEYFNAVWVKNEWSRFLDMIEKGAKKTLIPCFKDIDVYDIPKEFAHLQAQDMGKVGAVQDLLRGIDKIMEGEKPQKTEANVQVNYSNGANTESLLKRTFMFLEDGEWEKADNYCEQVLDIDPENAQAYVYKLCSQYHCCGLSEIISKISEEDYEQLSLSSDFIKALRFSKEDLKLELEQFQKLINNKISQKNGSLKFLRERAATVSKLVMTSAYCHCILGIKTDGTIIPGITKSDRSRWKYDICDWNNIVSVVSDESVTLGLKSDGTVVEQDDADGSLLNTKGFENIISLTLNDYFAAGLKSDGTIVKSRRNNPDKKKQIEEHDSWKELDSWKDIVAIANWADNYVGLKSDGTIITTSAYKYNAQDWHDIISIAAGPFYRIVGLRSDGSVITVGKGDNEERLGRTVLGWNNIVQVAFDEERIVGLKSTGTVVSASARSDERSSFDDSIDVSDWKDIVEICLAGSFTLGLKADGTVAIAGAVGYKEESEKIKKWDNLIALIVDDAYGYDSYVIGIKADGTAVSARDSIKEGRLDLLGWKLFDDVSSIKEEKKEKVYEMNNHIQDLKIAKEKEEEERKLEKERLEEERKKEISKLKNEKDSLTMEREELKGLFNGKRRKEIDDRVNEINRELDKLGSV